MPADRPDPDAEYWTISDIARYCGLATSTISTYRARGLLLEEDTVIAGRRLYRPARVVAWHAARPSQRNPGTRYGPGRSGRPETAFTRDAGIDWEDYHLEKRFERVEASDDVAALLEVEAGTLLLARYFVFRTAGEDRPRQMSTSYLLLDDVDGTPVADPDNEPWPGGTRAQLATIGIHVTSVDESYRVRMPTADEAATLHMPADIPVFDVTRRHLAGVRPVELAYPLVIPGDRGELRFSTRF